MPILELSRKIKRPYSQTHRNIKILEKKGLITLNTIGHTNLCIYNYKKDIITTSYIESLRTKEFLNKNKKIELLINKITSEFKIPTYTLIIFGSYVKGTETKTSDVDIAIITDEQNISEAERIEKYISNISTIRIHIIEFTYNDFSKMLVSKEEINVGKEMIKNHIIITGYENFYKTMEQTGW